MRRATPPQEPTYEDLLRENERLRKRLAAQERFTADSKTARREVLRREAQLRRIIDHIPHMIAVKDWHGHFVTANQAFAEVYDTTVAALEGAPQTDFHRDKDEVWAQLCIDREVMSRNESKLIENEEFTGADGNRRILQTTKMPIGGETPHVLCVSLDVTELRKKDSELRASRENLAEQVRQQTGELRTMLKDSERFSYTLSHDISGSLRRINGFAGVLVEDEENLSEMGQLSVEKIQAGVAKITGTMSSLHQLSRLSSGQAKYGVVDLSLIAEELAAGLRSDDSSRSVEFRIQPGLSAWGDEGLLRLALDNLIGNAWKYSQNEPQAVIEFGCDSLEDEPTFFVRDNGAGFDPRFSDNLFKAFGRLHNSKEFAGTGVGLETVKRVIDRHKGTIYGTGEVGKGAAFFFTLGQRPKKD